MRNGISDSRSAISARRYMVRTFPRSFRMVAPQRKLDFPVGRPLRGAAFEQGKRDVEDGNPVGGGAVGRPVVGVSVEHRGGAVPVQRLLETAGPEAGMELRRRAQDGRAA